MTDNSMISFRVPRELRERIEKRAAASGLDISNYCRAVMINVTEHPLEAKI